MPRNNNAFTLSIQSMKRVISELVYCIYYYISSNNWQHTVFPNWWIVEMLHAPLVNRQLRIIKWTMFEPYASSLLWVRETRRRCECMLIQYWSMYFCLKFIGTTGINSILKHWHWGINDQAPIYWKNVNPIGLAFFRLTIYLLPLNIKCAGLFIIFA